MLHCSQCIVAVGAGFRGEHRPESTTSKLVNAFGPTSPPGPDPYNLSHIAVDDEARDAQQGLAILGGREDTQGFYCFYGIALCLSPRTVQRHVANVYLKIGAHCRADATAYALDHGLR